MKSFSLNKKNSIHIVLILIAVFSFILRLWPLQIAHWWDETVYLQNAETIFFGRTNFDELQIRPPMLSIFFGLGFLVNHHVFTASTIAAVLGTLGVIFIYLLGKNLYGQLAGILAAAFLGFLPHFVAISRWLMTDMPSVTFLIMSFYFLSRTSRDRYKKNYIISGVLFSIAILTKFTATIILLPVFAYFYLRKEVRHVRFFLLGFLVSIFPYFLWVQIQYGFFLHTFAWANSVVGDQVGGPLYYFSAIVEQYTLMLPIFALAIGFLLAYALSFKGILKLNMKNKPDNFTLILILWAVIFLGYISMTPHKEPRYILPIIPPVILMASAGLSKLVSCRNKTMRFASMASFIILSAFLFAPAFLKLQEPPINTWLTDAMIASQYISSINMTGSILYVNDEHPVYAYYTGMKIEILSFQSDFYKRFPDNMKADGLFVYYKESKKDPNKEWLDSNPRFTLLKDTGTIIIYGYNVTEN